MTLNSSYKQALNSMMQWKANEEDKYHKRKHNLPKTVDSHRIPETQGIKVLLIR